MDRRVVHAQELRGLGRHVEARVGRLDQRVLRVAATFRVQVRRADGRDEVGVPVAVDRYRSALPELPPQQWQQLLERGLALSARIDRDVVPVEPRPLVRLDVVARREAGP